MIKLFVDTETTGKLVKGAPPVHHTTPRCVQLAMALVGKDGKEISHAKLLIKPEGYDIPQGAVDIHGITPVYAGENGLPQKVAMHLFLHFAHLSQEIWIFNAGYDVPVLINELSKIGKTDEVFRQRKVNCEMLACKDILKLTPKWVGGDYKYPSLIEAITYFTGKTEIAKAHDSLADVRALVEVHFARLKSQERQMAPAVAEMLG